MKPTPEGVRRQATMLRSTCTPFPCAASRLAQGAISLYPRKGFGQRQPLLSKTAAVSFRNTDPASRRLRRRNHISGAQMQVSHDRKGPSFLAFQQGVIMSRERVGSKRLIGLLKKQPKWVEQIECGLGFGTAQERERRSKSVKRVASPSGNSPQTERASWRCDPRQGETMGTFCD